SFPVAHFVRVKAVNEVIFQEQPKREQPELPVLHFTELAEFFENIKTKRHLIIRPHFSGYSAIYINNGIISHRVPRIKSASLFQQSVHVVDKALPFRNRNV